MTKLTADRRPETWDASTSWYDRVIAPNTSKYAWDAMTAAKVTASDQVLDVAAGTGAFSLQAAKLGATVRATDFSAGMVEYIKSRAAQEGVKLDATVMDGQNLVAPDGSFDVVSSIFGLIFFPNRIQGLKEMHRVLRPGGRAVLTGWSTPSKVRSVSIIGSALNRALPNLPAAEEPPAIFSWADPELIRAEARAAGFTKIAIQQTSHVWKMPSPDAVWSDLAEASPVFQALLVTLSKSDRELVRQAVIEDATKAMINGVVELPSEAHVVLLTR